VCRFFMRGGHRKVHARRTKHASVAHLHARERELGPRYLTAVSCRRERPLAVKRPSTWPDVGESQVFAIYAALMSSSSFP
jgi:hypothetical protein